jgi:predicted nucleic acid-binding protein
MIAVADTSPLCYLILIDEIGVLPKLFGKVVVPKIVITELLHEDAPDAVRGWTASLPPWVTVQENPIRGTAGLEKLQAGELAAILLAEAISAELILLDEKAARRAAAGRGLRVTGTLGILGEAAARGLVDLPEAIDRLRRTNFRCSPALLKSTLDRFTRDSGQADVLHGNEPH